MGRISEYVSLTLKLGKDNGLGRRNGYGALNRFLCCPCQTRVQILSNAGTADEIAGQCARPPLIDTRSTWRNPNCHPRQQVRVAGPPKARVAGPPTGTQPTM